MEIKQNGLLSDEQCDRIGNLMFVYHDKCGLSWPMIGKAVDNAFLFMGIKSEFEERFKCIKL